MRTSSKDYLTEDFSEGAEVDQANIAPSDALLTVEEVADRLGLSVSAIRMRTRGGAFHPIKKGNRVMYHPFEVNEAVKQYEDLLRTRKTVMSLPNQGRLTPLGRKPGKGAFKRPAKEEAPSVPEPSTPTKFHGLIYSGEQCAEAVRLFRTGKQVLDAVVEMQLTFEIAQHFWNQYLSMQSVWVLPSKQFAQLRTLYEWNEESPSPEGLAKAIRMHIDKNLEREVKIRIERELGQEVSAEEKAELARLDAEIAADAESKEGS